MKNDFNRVARYYQDLSNLIFGQRLLEAQLINLRYLEKGDRLLIVGGGDGHLLRYLPTNLELKISYVELSKKMVQLALEKEGILNIEYHEQDILIHQGTYDVIIANFFLDCFNEQSLNRVLQKLKTLLSPKGRFLVTDFALPKQVFDHILLWAMHRFFGVFSKLESEALVDIHKKILDQGFAQNDYQCLVKPRLFVGVYNLANQNLE